jgi:hypothetical protein
MVHFFTANNMKTIQILLVAFFATTQVQAQGIMLAGGAVEEEPPVEIPNTISDLALWLDASDMNGDFIDDNLAIPASTWVNKGNLGLGNFTKYGSPTMGTVSGLPSIYFDAESENYRSPNTSEYNFMHDGSTKSTMFVVLKPNNLTNSFNILLANAGVTSEVGITLLLDQSEMFDIYMRKGQSGTHLAYLLGDVSLSQSSLNVLKAEFDVGNATVDSRLESYVNDIQNANNVFSPSNPTTGNATYPLTIAKDPRGGIDDFRGYISEILIYSKELTPQEITNVENYLSTKYGL